MHTDSNVHQFLKGYQHFLSFDRKMLKDPSAMALGVSLKGIPVVPFTNMD